jgi:phosphatidylserine decarboxylase
VSKLAESSLERFLDSGTVFQNSIKASGYHRWHAPVTGEITEVSILPGSYDGNDKLPARPVIYILAENPVIEHVAILSVEMTEISSCEVTVAESDRVNRGDEIGQVS